MSNRYSRTPEQRFWEKVRKDQGCWEWTAARADTGYGHLAIDGHRVYAHRFSYELAHGEIPDGLQIDHLCRNRGCVNPDHLEAVTQRTNILRGTAPAAVNAAATQCPQGHPYDAENTYIIPNRGGRGCRACHRASEKARRIAGKIPPRPKEYFRDWQRKRRARIAGTGDVNVRELAGVR